MSTGRRVSTATRERDGLVLQRVVTVAPVSGGRSAWPVGPARPALSGALREVWFHRRDPCPSSPPSIWLGWDRSPLLQERRGAAPPLGAVHARVDAQGSAVRQFSRQARAHGSFKGQQTRGRSRRPNASPARRGAARPWGGSAEADVSFRAPWTSSPRNNSGTTRVPRAAHPNPVQAAHRRCPDAARQSRPPQPVRSCSGATSCCPARRPPARLQRRSPPAHANKHQPPVLAPTAPPPPP